MNKLPVFLILFFASSFLWAYDESWEIQGPILGANIFGEEVLTGDEPVKQKYRLKNRTAEFSIANMHIYAANNFVTAQDFFRDPIDMLVSKEFFREVASVNFNDFLSGFDLNLGTAIKPFSFNFNWKDQWGFGLDIAHIDVMGNVSLSGNMLSIHETEDKDKFGVGMAVFADMGIPVFFHYNDFKIKMRPSVYVPILYTEPNITYKHTTGTSKNGNLWTKIRADYDIRFFSLVDIEKIIDDGADAATKNLRDNPGDIFKDNAGYDIGLSIEYPYDETLDIGIDMVNIPIMKARLYHYAKMYGYAYFDTSKFDVADLIDGEFNPDDIYGYGEVDTENPIAYLKDPNGKKIYRPFTTLFYAKYRPFEEAPSISFTPSLGFSINRLYAQIGSIEGGLNITWDIANMVVTTIGVNYNDRKWKNSIDFILNLRAVEVDFGLSLQSSDFVKSWQGAGLGVTFGLKLGW